MVDEDGNYIFGNSKPCDHCLLYLKKYGVRRIFYSDRLENKNVMCELRLKF